MSARWSLFIQTLLLALIAFVIVIRLYGLDFADVVTINYFSGGTAFLNGLDPYEHTLRHGTANQFKYSPLFAVIVGEIARLSRLVSIDGLWVFFSAFLFFLGLSRWFSIAGKLKSLASVALVACLIDLAVSLSVKQINSWIAGLILLGVAEYRDKRFLSAGALLMLAANFKVYPVVFLIALMLPFNPQYFLGVVIGGVVCFVIPALFVGWSHNFRMHVVWFHLVVGEAGGAGALDVYSSLQRVGIGFVGQGLRWLIAIVTLPAFFLYPVLRRPVHWVPWMTLGFSTILLLSPRTEVFTYVMLAPCYVLLVAYYLSRSAESRARWAAIALVGCSLMIAASAFVDPQWMSSESPKQIERVIGALVFWSTSAFGVVHALLKRNDDASTISTRTTG